MAESEHLLVAGGGGFSKAAHFDGVHSGALPIDVAVGHGSRAAMSEPLPHAFQGKPSTGRSRTVSDSEASRFRHRRPDSIAEAYIQSHSYIASLANLGGHKGSPTKGSTMFQAAVNTTKLVVGVGSFALPNAFELAGMLGGVLGIPLLALWCAYSMKLMVDVRLDIGPRARYFDIGRETFGPWLEALMYACAIFASVGAAAGYLDFLAPLLIDIFETPTVTHLQIVALTSPVFILLCWIRSFRYMAFTSVLGDVAFILAMGTVFVYGFLNESIDFDRPALVTDTYPDFLGAAVFLYGICLFVMPQQSTMQRPSEFLPSVYASFAVTTVLNVAFGALGYALWGTTAKGVIIYNLHGTFAKCVKVLLTLDLTFSFPVVMSPARELSERFLLGSSPPPGWATEWKRNLIRTLLVVAAAALAVGVSSFLSMIGLVSGLALIATALVFPPLCYWQRFQARLSLVYQGFLWLLVLVGVAAAVFTTILAAKKVEKALS